MSSQKITDQIDNETFEFSGRRGPFFKLLLINLFLTIITLGIYRFWAKTNVRRFIWSNIRFMGDPLEYTGRGSELLLGFLIVLAVLFPLGLIYEAIQSLAPPDETTLHIGLEILYYTTILALVQIGFYRAWRYRMSRTTWRGIRLGLDGSTWTFLKLSIGWSVLTVLTIGIAYPWMAVELWRYQITHTRIGETKANLALTGRQLLPFWLFVLIPFWIVAGAAFWLAMISDFDTISFINLIGESDFPPVYQIMIVSVFAILTAMVVLHSFIFNLVFLRHAVSELSLSNAGFFSKLPIGRLLFFATLAGALALAIAGGITALIMTSGSAFFQSFFVGSLTADSANSASEIFGTVLILIAFFFISPFAWTLIYQFEFLKQLFSTTTVSSPGALEHVVQSASESQKTGEGLADALDIGGL